MVVTPESVSFGLSPCPNDTFITYAINTSKIESFPIISTQFADVQELNAMALDGVLDISKISVAVYPKIAKEYTMLSCGGAMGLSCGPIVVCRSDITREEAFSLDIAIPGEDTTANALVTLHGGFTGKKRYMVFDEIIPALMEGIIDVGVLIHESRFECEHYGLQRVVDLGDFWEERYALPLPLGAIVMRRSLGEKYKTYFEGLLRESLQYSYAHKEEALLYCKQYAQAMDTKILQSHIDTFVNEYTMDVGIRGKNAIENLTQALLKK